MSPSLPWIAAALDELNSAGLLRYRRESRFLADGRYEMDGRPVLDFASNDYLGLAGDPRLVSAAMAALSDGSVGARASPLVCGHGEWQQRLVERLAAFEGEPDAVLFPTGMAANIGTIAAVCGPDDLILCDRLNHASLVDGCRLSKAKMRVYRHEDLTTLERELSKETSAVRRWIVTDTVFSMDGDIAPLQEICEIADRFGAELIVDEAHGTGVLGARGRGACEALGVEGHIAIRIGTLSKAIGTQGGFVAGSRELVQYLWNRARTQVYSTALAPPLCAAATEAINIIEAEPWRRTRLGEAAAGFRQRLQESRVETIAAATGPIVPVLLRDPNASVDIATRLLQRGFLVGAIRPPTVPHETSRLRIVIHSNHSDDDLTRLADAVREEIQSLPG
jgi:8-amino-7-oxononanoate synthase